MQNVVIYKDSMEQKQSLGSFNYVFVTSFSKPFHLFSGNYSNRKSDLIKMPIIKEQGKLLTYSKIL